MFQISVQKDHRDKEKGRRTGPNLRSHWFGKIHVCPTLVTLWDPAQLSMASPEALSASGMPALLCKLQEASTAADAPQKPWKLLVVGSWFQLVLQPFLASSWESADPRQALASHSVLWEFCWVAGHRLSTGIRIEPALNLWKLLSSPRSLPGILLCLTWVALQWALPALSQPAQPTHLRRLLVAESHGQPGGGNRPRGGLVLFF